MNGYFTGDFLDFILDSDIIMFWVTNDDCIPCKTYTEKN